MKQFSPQVEDLFKLGLTESQINNFFVSKGNLASKILPSNESLFQSSNNTLSSPNKFASIENKNEHLLQNYSNQENKNILEKIQKILEKCKDGKVNIDEIIILTDLLFKNCQNHFYFENVSIISKFFEKITIELLTKYKIIKFVFLHILAYCLFKITDHSVYLHFQMIISYFLIDLLVRMRLNQKTKFCPILENCLDLSNVSHSVISSYFTNSTTSQYKDYSLIYLNTQSDKYKPNNCSIFELFYKIITQIDFISSNKIKLQNFQNMTLFVYSQQQDYLLFDLISTKEDISKLKIISKERSDLLSSINSLYYSISNQILEPFESVLSVSSNCQSIYILVRHNILKSEQILQISFNKLENKIHKKVHKLKFLDKKEIKDKTIKLMKSIENQLIIANNSNQIISFNISNHKSSVANFDSDIMNISCGKSHCLILTKNNKVYGMGTNNFNQICFSDEILFKEPILISHFDFDIITQIFAFNNFSFVINKQNECQVFGKINNQLSLKYPQSIRSEIDQNDPIINITADNKSLCLSSIQSIYNWEFKGIKSFSKSLKENTLNKNNNLSNKFELKLLEQNLEKTNYNLSKRFEMKKSKEPSLINIKKANQLNPIKPTKIFSRKFKSGKKENSKPVLIKKKCSVIPKRKSSRIIINSHKKKSNQPQKTVLTNFMKTLLSNKKSSNKRNSSKQIKITKKSSQIKFKNQTIKNLINQEIFNSQKI